MVIRDEKILNLFRGSGWCSWCRKQVARLEPDHLFTRGAGRLDVRWNIAALCPPCHRQRHDGNISRSDLLAVVAQREGVLQDNIVDAVYFFRRLPKHATEEMFRREALTLNYATQSLVKKEWTKLMGEATCQVNTKP